MAWAIAARTTGSPSRATRRLHPGRGVSLQRFLGADDVPRQHQAPGRGIDEQRVGIARMRAPVAGTDLLGNEAISGVVVGNAQQRLGQAQQHHAFPGAQRIFEQEGIETRMRMPCGTDRTDDAFSLDAHARGLVRRQTRALDSGPHQPRFRHPDSRLRTCFGRRPAQPVARATYCLASAFATRATSGQGMVSSSGKRRLPLSLLYGASAFSRRTSPRTGG